jgi:RecA/RadA recombinase
MTAPIDMSKFRKKVDKSLDISHGFNDPRTWLNTGCYALNYLISDEFTGGVPLEGKFTMFAGDSGSGKSYICSANLIKDAQAKGVFPVIIDTENALDESWMLALGVDTAEDKMIKIMGVTIDSVSAMIGSFLEQYREENDKKAYLDRPKVLFVIDSVGQMITPNNEKQFMEGDQKGDMGIKAKQITNMIKVIMSKIGSQPIGLLATNHVYDSQDQYKPDTIPGGKALEFSSSVIVQMNKLLLKEDEFGTKLTDGEVAGIKSSTVVRKSRYAKPFEKLKINIPYDTGMDPYSGLFDLFQKKGLLVKDGNRWTYTSPLTGEILTDYKKKYKANGWLDRIMDEREQWDVIKVAPDGFDDSDGKDYNPNDDED